MAAKKWMQAARCERASADDFDTHFPHPVSGQWSTQRRPRHRDAFGDSSV